MVNEIEHIWTALEGEPRDGGYVQRAIFPESKLHLFIGIESTGARKFIFAARRDAIANYKLPASSDGLEIRRVQRSDYGENKIVHSVTLTNLKYRELFTILISDICKRALPPAAEADAYANVLLRITDWQRFLAKHDQAGLSDEARRGLYGELSFIRDLVKANLIKTTGIGCWRGPYGADQDFQFPRIALEAKVSLSAQNQEIIISSERQLDNRNFDTMFLFHMALSLRRNSGESLNQLVDILRQTIPANLLNDFEEGLFESGYLDAHRELYEDDCYTIREKNYFEVRENFPRITELQLQTTPGVGKVRYAISIPACKKFSVSESKVLAVVRGAYD